MCIKGAEIPHQADTLKMTECEATCRDEDLADSQGEEL